jgi:hypothetical protein
VSKRAPWPVMWYGLPPDRGPATLAPLCHRAEDQRTRGPSLLTNPSMTPILPLRRATPINPANVGTGDGAQGTGHRARVTGHGSRVMGHGSRVTGHGSRVTGHGSRVTDRKTSFGDLMKIFVLPSW